MTYEKLLAEIDMELEITHWEAWHKGARALRAVVELCNTAINGKPNTDYSMGYVAACERIIKAIEKELG